MITSAKNYTKSKPDRQNTRANGKSKCIQTKSHKEAYTYTLTKREQEKIYICIFKKRKRATKSINNLSLLITLPLLIYHC